MSYSKLVGRIYEKYGSVSAFARIVGKSRTAVYNKLNDRTDFSKTEMDQWADLLGIKQKEIGEYFFAPNVTKAKQ